MVQVKYICARTLFTVLLLLVHGLGQAEIDMLELVLSQPQATKVQWQLVHKGFHWSSGVMPDSDGFISLEKNTHTAVRVPAYTRLRLKMSEKCLSIPRVEESNGTGLFTTISGRVQNSNLYLKPRPDRNSLLIISSPTNSCTFRAYLADRVLSRPVLPYRSYIEAESAVSMRLERVAPKKFSTWTQVAAGEELVFNQIHSKRVKIEACYHFREFSNISRYQVELGVKVGTNPVQQHLVLAIPETRYQFRLQGTPAVVSREESIFVSIPNKASSLRLRPSAPLLVRVLALDADDALVPYASSRMWRAWRQGEQVQELQHLEEIQKRFMTYLFQSAKDSYTVGLTYIRSALQAVSDWPMVAGEIEKKEGFYTFFRELLPQNFSVKDSYLPRAFVSPVLDSLRNNSFSLHLGKQHMRDYLRYLNRGIFHKVGSGKARALVYAVPRRITDTTLRLTVIDKRKAASFRVQFDDQSPVELRFEPSLIVADSDFKPNIGAVLLKKILDKSLVGYLDYGLAHHQLAEVGNLQITLPSEITTVKVWSDQSDELEIHLAYRDNRTLEPNPHALKSLESAVGRRFLKALLERNNEAESSTPSLPSNVRKRLRSLAHEFLLQEQNLRPGGKLPQLVLSGDCLTPLHHAERLRSQYPIAAFRLLHRSIVSCPEEIAVPSAQKLRTQLLLSQHEPFLAQTLLIQDLYSNSPTRRESAWKQLLALARQHSDYRTELRVAESAVVLLGPKPHILRRLGTLFLRVGRFEDAVVMYKLSGLKDVDVDLLYEASFFSQHGPFLKLLINQDQIKSRAAYWTRRATTHFSLAASPSLTEQAPPWRAAISRERTYSMDGVVTTSAGTVTLQSRARSKFQHYWLASSVQALTAQIEGPLVVELEARQIADLDKRYSSVKGGVQGWFEIELGESKQHLPLLHSEVSRNLLTSPEGKRVTLASRYNIAVPPGQHTLRIRSEAGPILLGLQRRSTNFDEPQVFIKEQEGDKLLGVVSEFGADKSLDDQSQAVDKAVWEISQLLYKQEYGQLSSLSALIKAQSRYGRSSHPEVVRLLGRLRQKTTWRRIGNVQQSAGTRQLFADEKAAESPAGRIREILLPPLSKNQYRVPTDRDIIVALKGDIEDSIALQVRLDDLTAHYLESARIKIFRNEKLWKSTDIQYGTPLEFSIPVNEDDQYLRIKAITSGASQYLTATIGENNPALSAQFEQSERIFHVVTPETPLRYVPLQPTIIRIDRYSADGVVSQEQVVQSAMQAVIVQADEQEPETLVRLFERVALPELEPTFLKITQPVLGSELVYGTLSEAPLGPYSSASPIDEPQTMVGESTYGASVALRRRRIFDDSSTQSVEEFLEFGSSWRSASIDQEDFVTIEGFVRTRENGDPSLGIGYRYEHVPEYSSWSGLADISAGMQQINFESGEHLHWITTGRLEGRHRLAFGETVFNSFILGTFLRGLSGSDGLLVEPENVDQDIFSLYKEEHRTGIYLDNFLSYQPWLDTRSYLRTRVRGNEGSALLSADQLGAELGLYHQTHGWGFGAAYRLTHFNDDEDRSSSSSRHALALQLDWLSWARSPLRCSLQTDVRYDFDDDAISARLSLNFDFTNGRFLRDFSPRSIDQTEYRRFRAEQEFLDGTKVKD